MAQVEHHVEPTTQYLKSIVIDVKERGLDRPLLEGKRLILLDTPGLDAIAGHDAVNLRHIAIWLAR